MKRMGLAFSASTALELEMLSGDVILLNNMVD
jgi:hypothetical protein